jgi:hypothetical protein
MHLTFIKNIQFTKLIKADGRLREFNFRRYNSGNQQLGTFSVNVVDNRDNRIIFEMNKEDNSWKIIKQQLPPWILENESNFNESIEEELRNAEG